MRDLSLHTPRRGDRISQHYLSGLQSLAGHNHVPNEGMVSRDGVVEVPQQPALAERRFELSGELSGGLDASASVKWLQWDSGSSSWIDSGDTGTVVAAQGTEYGLTGERGLARKINGRWEIVKNPGSDVYRGTLISATSTTGSKNCSIPTLGVTLSAYLYSSPGSGKQWPQSAVLFIGYTQEGEFAIISITECPEDIP